MGVTEGEFSKEKIGILKCLSLQNHIYREREIHTYISGLVCKGYIYPALYLTPDSRLQTFLLV